MPEIDTNTVYNFLFELQNTRISTVPITHVLKYHELKHNPSEQSTWGRHQSDTEVIRKSRKHHLRRSTILFFSMPRILKKIKKTPCLFNS